MGQADRIPPHSLDAEQSVLCLEMLDPDGYWTPIVNEICPLADFYSDVHRKIQKAILAVHEREGVSPVLAVQDELDRSGDLNDVGGYAYLHDILQTIYFGPHAAIHAGIVAEKAAKRKCLIAAKTLLDASYDESLSALDMTTNFLRTAEELNQKLLKETKKHKTLHRHMHDVVDAVEEGEEPTIRMFIPEVDDMTHGISKGEVMVVGGLTSMGKTLFAVQSLHEATIRGQASLLISNEMPGKGIASRLMQKVSTNPEELFKDVGKLRYDIDRFYEDRAPLIIAEHCSTIAEVERTIAKSVRDHNIQVVALDYCQLVSGTGFNREQQVADVSRKFKQCVIKHGIVGMLLSQLNRVSAKDARPPVLSDLRESGALEHDADVVLFVWWEAKSNANAHPYKYKIIQAKNRQRGTSIQSVDMRINPVEQWLYPYSTEEAGDMFD